MQWLVDASQGTERSSRDLALGMSRLIFAAVRTTAEARTTAPAGEIHIDNGSFLSELHTYAVQPGCKSTVYHSAARRGRGSREGSRVDQGRARRHVQSGQLLEGEHANWRP